MDNKYIQFGYQGALYLQSPIGNQYNTPKASDKVNKVIKLIEQYNAPAQFVVEGVKKRYNATINEILKEVTGLKYRHKQNSSYNRVAINIVTSIPPQLAEIIDKADLVEIELILRFESLIQSNDYLNFIQEHFFKILHIYPDLNNYTSFEDIARVYEFLENLKKTIINSELYKQLKSLTIDNLLGAYFFYKHTIELYWPALAFYSSWNGMPLSDLAFIVLAHEKAHAITHLGYDLDGEVWDTNAFRGADIKIVEGLAQHYTEHVCRNVAFSFSAVDSFEALLKDQSEPYRCYRNWISDERNRDERIRLAMLNSRKLKIKDYNEFCTQLKNSKNAIGQPEEGIQGSIFKK